MTVDPIALAWAKARAAGPLRVAFAGAEVPGMVRLAEPGGEWAWLVPQLPVSADVRVPRELGLPVASPEQPNDTARALAACLRCCWVDPVESLWPGREADVDEIMALFRALTEGRDNAAQHRALLAALRRMHGAGWLLFDEPAARVRLGPRVALWSAADLSVLRQLWRSLPSGAIEAEHGTA